jgi:mannitol 2-dehydrogenase
LAFIANRQVFGDLVDDERFTTAYTSALEALHSRGARATLEGLMGYDRDTPESTHRADA